jgi:hypothetical protein
VLQNNATQDRTLDKGAKDKFNKKAKVFRHKFEGLTILWDFMQRFVVISHRRFRASGEYSVER